MIFKAPVYGVMNSPQKMKILKFLLSGSEIPDMSERELARMVKTSNASVNRAMVEFEAMNLVSYKRTGSSHVWRVIRDSYAYPALKRIVDALSGMEEPRDSLISTLKKGLKGTNTVRAVLFGSVSRGEERPGSDIDLLVVVREKKDIKGSARHIEELGRKCLTLYGNPLSPVVLTEKEYRESKNRGAVKDAEKGIRII